MILPESFKKYEQRAQKKGKFRHVLIASQGNDNTGKNEFALSAPGPSIMVAVDPGYDGCDSNPNPPAARQNNCLVIPYTLLMNKMTTDQSKYADAWTAFRDFYYETLDNPDSITSILDGDSDTYELLKLAVHGRVEKVPPMAYAESDALKRAFTYRQKTSGKNVISTFKMRDEFVDKVDPFGNKVIDKDGKPEKVKSGGRERQGFRDHEYLWQIQLEHMYKPGTTKVIEKGIRAGETIVKDPSWGIKILRCKASRKHEGAELWNEDCNFQGLVQLIWPDVPLSEWGY